VTRPIHQAVKLYPLYCRATRGGGARGPRPCNKPLSRRPYPVVPTKRILETWEEVNWDRECFGERCPDCNVITEYTWEAGTRAASETLRRLVPYVAAAHVVLSDWWRLGKLASDSASLPLLATWTRIHGVAAPMDVTLLVYAESRPGKPQVWPNGFTDACMPGNGQGETR
jgi:hypothetical protein